MSSSYRIKVGIKMHMVLWQAIMLLVGAIVGFVGRILHREKLATLGDAMAIIGAGAIIYSVLAVAL